MRLSHACSTLLLLAAAAHAAGFSAKFDPHASTALYSDAAGFGYEPGASPSAFAFSFRVPEEGNYKVTVALGDAQESTTTVKAELRRLMLEQIHVAPGASATHSFLVNVRTPKNSGRRRGTA